MHVSEEQRRALHDRLREHLDEETADLVLEVTVPANMELATRPDLLELRAEILLRLGVRIDELDARLSARIDSLSARIDGLNARMDALTARVEELGRQITGVEKAVDDLGARLSRQLITRVVPLMLAGIGAFVALANWLG